MPILFRVCLSFSFVSCRLYSSGQGFKDSRIPSKAIQSGVQPDRMYPTLFQSHKQVVDDPFNPIKVEKTRTFNWSFLLQQVDDPFNPIKAEKTRTFNWSFLLQQVDDPFNPIKAEKARTFNWSFLLKQVGSIKPSGPSMPMRILNLDDQIRT